MSVRNRGLCELIGLAFQSQQGLTVTIDHGNNRKIQVSKAMVVQDAKTIVVGAEIGGAVGDGLG